jgi:hypothetical protein
LQRSPRYRGGAQRTRFLLRDDTRHDVDARAERRADAERREVDDAELPREVRGRGIDLLAPQELRAEAAIRAARKAADEHAPRNRHGG